jgi:RNA polymerase sigma factor (sigma-70 family)
MKPRQSLIAIFSDFLKLDSHLALGWISDPRLRRSMQRHLELPTDNSDQVWALYWHQIWQAEASPLAAAHLTAYVQESCYWAAQKIASQAPSQQTLADLFQTAIANVPHILNRFDAQLGASFKSYAERVFSNVIKDSLRRQQEVNICSDWSLLNKVSQKRLIEALTKAGLNQPKIAVYVMAWRCYQELYAPAQPKPTRQLTRPPAEVWGAIAQLFNQHAPGPTATPEELEKWLLAIAKAIRIDQLPTLVSANTPRPGSAGGELLDSLPAPQTSLLNALIESEAAAHRQAQQAQLSAVLTGAIAQLEPDQQTLLQVYYGQALTQQEIAQRLNLKQYTISRRLTSIRGKLLRVLAQWVADSLHVPLTSSVLEAMNVRLEEWLSQHMQSAASQRLPR